jgi:hypothetical protein
MSDFVDTVMPSPFNPNGKIPEPGPGVCDGDDQPPFSQYRRTPSGNGVKEKLYDGAVPTPSGESDHF